MNPTLNTILYWLTLPLKPIALFLAWLYDLYWFSSSFKLQPNQGRKPDQATIQAEYAALVAKLPQPQFTVPGPQGPLYNMSSTDQALRQGSVCWATRDPGFIGGLGNFVYNGQFIRGWKADGTPDLSEAGPAMPSSVAFGITVALENGVPIPPALKQSFLAGVDTEIANHFTRSNVSLNPQVTTTAFDVLYVCCLSLTAYRISQDPKYLAPYRQSMFWQLGLLLLPWPYAFLPSRRPFYLEHVLTYMAWTCVFNALDPITRWTFRRAGWMVYRLSSHANQPYLAALALQMGAIEADDPAIPALLDAHADVNLDVHSQWFNLQWDNTQLYGYVPFSDGEFTLDMNPAGIPTRTGTQQGYTIVSGLTMGRSLLTLLG